MAQMLRGAEAALRRVLRYLAIACLSLSIRWLTALNELSGSCPLRAAAKRAP
jgi:hypothetical protein